MTVKRYIQGTTVKVEMCDHCGKTHEYPVEIVIDQEMDATGMMRVWVENHDIVLSCPTKHKSIVVSVPVSLHTLQKFVRFQPGR